MSVLEEFGIAGRFGKVVIVCGLVLVACFALFIMFSDVVWPGQVGLLQVKLGIETGYQDGFEKPRRYIVIPLKETMHVLPVTLQYENILSHKDRQGKTVGGVTVPTTD